MLEEKTILILGFSGRRVSKGLCADLIADRYNDHEATMTI
jgi:hypothetical protein